jgi:beta-N-acetylhexosaminidase
VALALAGCASDGDSVSVPRAEPTVAQRTTPTPPAGGAEGATVPPTPEPETEAPAQTVPHPPIVQWRIPFTAERRRDMAAYSLRHYGESEWRLIDPQLIVQHWTQTSDLRATREIFVPNRADPELNERPGTCSHFLISQSGTIYQLVDLGTRCRHAFGVNWTAIGIEHMGRSDAEILGNRRQLAASLALTRWLSCTYGIETSNVIGHAETAASPYWQEIRRGGRDTHDDMGERTMATYRSRLAARGCT